MAYFVAMKSTTFIANQLVRARSPSLAMLSPVLRQKSAATASTSFGKKRPLTSLDSPKSVHLNHKNANQQDHDSSMLPHPRTAPVTQKLQQNPDIAGPIQSESNTFSMHHFQDLFLQEDPDQKRLATQRIESLDAAFQKTCSIIPTDDAPTNSSHPIPTSRSSAANPNWTDMNLLTRPVILCHGPRDLLHASRASSTHQADQTEPIKKRQKLMHAAVARTMAEITAKDMVRTSLVRATIILHQLQKQRQRQQQQRQKQQQ